MAKTARHSNHPKTANAAVTAFSQDPLRDQFFLSDTTALEKMVLLSGVRKTDTVLEIGAGDGRLTEALAGRCKKVIAVEMDVRLRPLLSERFAKKKNVELIFCNALDAIPMLSGKYDVVVSNPPYSISEPLVRAFFAQTFREAVLTIPSDFVARIAANPEEHAYSKLSLFSQAFFRIEALMPVGRGAWQPRPRTDSTVVRLTPRKASSARERTIRALALQEDKKLGNALREAFAGAPGGSRRKGRERVSKAGIRADLLGKKVASLTLREIMEVLEALG